MNDEKLTELAAEMDRQNEALAEIEATMRALGDVELAVPKAFLDELDELTTPRTPTPAIFTYALRG
jgi:hypothetical protein